MPRNIYFGGPILTMEEPVYAQALVEDGGVIRYVGDRETALELAGPQARKIDLEGRTMMPAFLDPHSHFMACANAMLQVQLGECADQEEICARLAAFIKREQLPPGEWVRGTGYDQNELAQGTPPDRWMLDRACPDHPVVIQHASGHVGVFNSRALELLGVDENTPCPQGGVMEKDGQGRLTGYMEENAFLGLLQKVPMPDLEDLMDALVRAQEQYASYGIATVQEGMFMDGMLPLYQAMLARKLLKVDVVAYADPRNCQKIMEQFGERVGRYQDHVKIGGDKIFLDGSPQGRTAWMRQPYEGERDYRGYPALTDEQVYERLKSASERGVQILAHCNGDGAAAPAGDDPRPACGAGSAAPAQSPGDDSLLLCGPRVPLGGDPCEKFRPGAGGAYQPRRCGQRLGAALHLPPGFPGDPPQHAGDYLVCGQPPHQDGPGAGGGGENLHAGGVEGGDPPCCLPVF